ncbi:HNH endonuclease [Leeia sp. TBRC 13508]|uniref:HNH endonuclease n=1 Tax=Leeia speluncae TaxID=2884804 RepID=A0ABS8D4F7_9NEIS|nr:HNH endonuclease signature motif containing protein [Leeia speluncae]MCB6183051.1 HNH endonuclease [Leeia speluncae]
MFKNYIRINWRHATEYVPIDLSKFSVDTQVTSTIEEWFGEEVSNGDLPSFVRYNTESKIKKLEDNTIEIQITYKQSANAEMDYEHMQWGISTIIIPLGAHEGEASWNGFESSDYDGTVNWTYYEQINNDRPRSSKNVTNRNQGPFRKALICLDKCCALTGESTSSALEAAHIIPVSEGGYENIDNGILLRADLHRLYDDNKFIFLSNGTVKINSNLSSTYQTLLQSATLPVSVLKRVKDSLAFIEATDLI